MDGGKSPIAKVTLGAGSRKNPVVVGGSKTLLGHSAKPSGRKPVIAHDVFDMPVGLPSPVRECYSDVLQDPASWAKKQVRSFGAEMVTLHLVSTDPNLKDTSARQAAKTVEEVLQAVKVPIIISGSGNHVKDVEVLSAAAEAASGERCLLSAVSNLMDYGKVAEAALEHGHAILSMVSMDPSTMKQVNLDLIRRGLTPEDIILDPVTGSIGYGIEYTVSTIERIRIRAYAGDKELAMPILSASSNAWSAREAWMKHEGWGPRERRGPLWEYLTAQAALLAGADLFMMLHSRAIGTLRETIDGLYGSSTGESIPYREWVVVR